MFLCQLAAPFASHHAVKAEEDEGDAEQLAHVEEHIVLETYLVLLGVFDEYAAGEDEEQTEAEVEARAYLGILACASFLRLHGLPVNPPSDEEEKGVAQGLVELPRVAWNSIHTLEDKGPGYIRGTAYNLGIHEVAHTYGTGTDGCHDAHIVEHAHDIELHVTGIEPEGYHEAQGASVTGKAFVACKLPAPVGQLADGKHHFHGVREEILRFVEKAMAQAGTNEYAQEAVHEHGVELLLADFLLTVQTVHEQIDAQQAYAPAKRVPANGDEAEVQGYYVRVPGDE